MSDVFRFSRTVRQRPIHLNVVQQGADWCLMVSGGDAPHIGATALAEPDGTTRCLEGPGHKEGVLACELARRTATNLQCRACAVCGIHFESITKQEIDRVVATVLDMLDEWLNPIRRG